MPSLLGLCQQRHTPSRRCVYFALACCAPQWRPGKLVRQPEGARRDGHPQGGQGDFLMLLFSGAEFAAIWRHVAISKVVRAQVTLADVIIWSRDNILTERPELFMKDNSVWVPPLTFKVQRSWDRRWCCHACRLSAVAGGRAYWCWLMTQTGS